MKKERGSALIIAVLLIAAVAGMAFGVARLFFIETAVAGKYEDGAVAYYAAESGMEEGFLRYRFNQNAEVPFDFKLTKNTNRAVYRTNITDKAVRNSTGLLQSNSLMHATNGWSDSTTPADQIYDLRMGYLGTNGSPFNGHDVDQNGLLGMSTFSSAQAYGTGDNSIFMIKKDEDYKVDLSGYGFNLGSAYNLNFGIKFVGLPKSSTEPTNIQICRSMAEIKFTVKYASGETKEYKVLYMKQGCFDTLQGDSVVTLNRAGIMEAGGDTTGTSETSPAWYLRSSRLQDVIDLYNKGILPSSTEKVTLSIRPLNYDAAFGLTTLGCTDSVTLIGGTACTTKLDVPGGPYSYISSTGYYGGTARKLEANIDRQSGTLYDLFDYVIFKQN